MAFRNQSRSAGPRLADKTPLTRIAQSKILATLTVLAVTLATMVGGATSVGAATTSGFAQKQLSLELIEPDGSSAFAIQLNAAAPSEFGIVLWNSGHSRPSTPARPQVTLTLPAGVSLVSLSTYDAVTAHRLTLDWTCTNSEPPNSIQCSLSAPRRIIQSLFGPNRGVIMLATVTNNLIPGAEGTIQVAASLAGVGTTSANAGILVSESTIPDVTVLRSVAATIGANQPSSIAYALKNLGPTATSAVGTVLADVLPVSGISEWKLASPDWSCVGGQDSSPRCTYNGEALPPGATSAPLILTFVHAHSPEDLQQSNVNWTSRLEVFGARGLHLTQEFEQSVREVPDSRGYLSVEVNLMGAQQVVPGSTRSVDIVQQATLGSATGLITTLVVPSGATILPVHNDDWSCPGGSGKVSCIHAGPVVTALPVRLSLVMHFASTMKSGLGVIGVASTTGNHLVKGANLALVNLTSRSGTSQLPSPLATTHHGGHVSKEKSIPKPLIAVRKKAPSVPISLRLVPGVFSATATWQAPISNGGAPILRYLVSDHVGHTCLMPASVLTCKLSGLEVNHRYTFNVVAFNSLGASAPSAPSTVIPVAPSVPSVPAALKVVPSTSSVVASWLAPTSNGGAPITSYTVTASPGGISCRVAVLTCTLTGLSLATRYTFSVRATNSAGNSAPSTSVVALTSAGLAPSAPTGLSLVAGNGSVVASWNSPTSSGSTPIASYLVTDGLGHSCTVSAQTTTCSISGLTNGTTSSFYATATNAAGASPHSIVVSVKPGSLLIEPSTILTLAGLSVSGFQGSTNAEGVFSGAASASIGGLNFATTVTYASPTSWSLAGKGSTSILGGTATVTGGVTTSGTTIDNSLSIKLAGSDLSSQVRILGTFNYGASTFAGSGTLTIGNTSLPVTFSYHDAKNWSAAVSNASINIGSIANLTVNGALQAVAGSLSGSLTATNAVAIDLGGGLTISPTLRFSYPQTSLSPAFTDSVNLNIGNTAIPVTFTYRDAKNWSIGTGSNGHSASVPLDVFGNLTATGSLTNTGGSIAGSFILATGDTAIHIGSGVALSGSTAYSYDANATVAKFSGSMQLSIGASSVPVNFTYVNGTNWSLSLTGASLTVALGRLSASGTMTDTAGKVSGSLALSTPAGGLNLGGGVTLTGSLTLAFYSTAALSVTGSMNLTIGSFTLPVTFNYQDSNNWTVTASDAEINLGAGGTLLVNGTLTNASGSLYGQLTAQTPDAIDLGGGVHVAPALAFSYPSTSSIPAFTGTVELSIGGNSFPVTFNFQDSNNWTVTASDAEINLGAGGTLLVNGTLTNASGSLYGQLTAQTPDAIDLGGGINVSPSLTFSYPSSSSIPAFSGTVELSIGGNALTATFTYQNANNWSAAISSESISLGSSGTLLVSGTLTESDGSLSGSLTASSTSPISLGSGVSATPTLTFTYSSTLSSAVFLGSVDLAFNGFSLPVQFSYTNALNWTATVTPGSGSLNLFTGFSISTSIFTGSIKVRGGAFTWNVTASLGSATLGGVVNLSGMSLSLGTACPLSTPAFCTQGVGSAFLALTGQVSLTTGSVLDGGSIPFKAAFGFSNRSFELDFMPTIIVLGLKKTPSVALSSGTLGSMVISASFSTPFALGSTGAAINGLAWSNAAQTVTVNGRSLNLSANTFEFSGTFTLPTSFSQFGLGGSNVAVNIRYSSATNYALSVPLSGAIALPNLGGYYFTLTSPQFDTGFSLAKGGLFAQVTIGGTMTVPATSGSSSQTINIDLSASYDSSDQFIVAISANGANGTSIWSNAFGLSGLNLNGIAIQLGVQVGTPIPNFGIAATGTLPPSLLNALGAQGAPLVSIVINVSDTNPCLSVSLSPGPGQTNAVNIANGLVTAQSANFTAAPNGCTVGTFDVAPGFSESFSGSFLGVGIDFNASLDPINGAMAASFGIGSFSLNGFNFNGAKGCLSIRSATSDGLCSNPAGLTASFKGNLTISGVKVSVSGSFSSGDSFSFSGVASLNLAGFSTSVTVVVCENAVGCLGTFNVTGSSSLKVPGGNVAISGSFSSGTSYSFSGTANLTIAGFSANTKIDVCANATDCKGSSYVTGNASLGVAGVVSVNLKGNFTPTTYSLSGDANFSPGGFNLGSATFSATPTSLRVSIGSVSSFGIFSGSVNAGIVKVGSSAGFDVSLSAGFSLPSWISGASLSGSLRITNCENLTCSSTSSVMATLTGSASFFGANSQSFSISVGTNASFSYSLNFDFSADDSFSIGDVTLGYSVSGYGGVTISSTGVTLSESNLTASAYWDFPGFTFAGLSSGRIQGGLTVGVGIDGSGVYVALSRFTVGYDFGIGCCSFDIGGQKYYVWT
jgi:hypothetical protein